MLKFNLFKSPLKRIAFILIVIPFFLSLLGDMAGRVFVIVLFHH
jgi:hypothetical protein